MAHGGFWRELKRRHVYRVAAGYAIVGWLLIQVATQVFPVFRLPGWIDRAVVLLILVGFPIALVLAWAFDATPHGIVRTADTAGAPPRRSHRAGIAVGLIGVLVAVVAGAAWWHAQRSRIASGHSISARPLPAKSIAVLPFANLSGDPKQAYFSDGITEEILNALAKIPDLKVAGRTSAFQFNSKDENPRKVGQTLGVANLLEGSVQKAGDEVRINVQLIDVGTGYQRWSEKYDRKLTNIFAIEDDISSAIAGKLRVQLTAGAGQALVAQEAVDPRAHDFYLRGLTLLAARGPGLRDAAAAFQNAVQIAPDYAQGWGALAETQALYPDYDLGTMQAAYPSALAAAQHALALDANTVSAYVAQGMVYKSQWRWADADRAFRRALALAPSDVEAIDQYAQFLGGIGQLERALMEIERAQRLDPLSAIVGTVRATFLLGMHRGNAAVAQIERTLAAHPDFALAQGDALGIYVDLHRFPEAEKQARLFAKLAGLDPDAEALVVRGIADPALRARAVQSLETSASFAKMRRRRPLVHASLLAELGAGDPALEVLERFAAEHDSSHPEILWDPSFDPIRNDPRFKAVLKKMGLPYLPLPTDSAP